MVSRPTVRAAFLFSVNLKQNRRFYFYILMIIVNNMKQLESYVTEKLRVSTNHQEITVESLIDALYNYGPSLHLKDVFGRGRVILEPSEYLDKDEEGYGGSKIFEIYFNKAEPWRNVPGHITLYGMHKTTRLDIFVKCEIGEDEKLHSLFRPGVLNTIYKYLIEHKH